MEYAKIKLKATKRSTRWKSSSEQSKEKKSNLLAEAFSDRLIRPNKVITFPYAASARFVRLTFMQYLCRCNKSRNQTNLRCELTQRRTRHWTRSKRRKSAPLAAGAFFERANYECWSKANNTGSKTRKTGSKTLNLCILNLSK